MISFIHFYSCLYIFSFHAILSLSMFEFLVLSQDTFDVGAKGGRETLLPPAPQS